MRKAIKAITQSASLMTFFSMFVRSFSPLVIIPFGLISNSEQDIALYLLLLTVVQICYFIDFGLTPTLSRFIAYAGNKVEDKSQESSSGPSVGLIPENIKLSPVIKFTHILYCILSVGVLAFLVILRHSIGDSASFENENIIGKYAWNTLIVGMPVLIWGMKYSIFLTGTNKIHIEQTAAFIVGVISIVAQILAMIFFGKLLIIFIVMIGFEVLGVFLKRALSIRYCFDIGTIVHASKVHLSNHLELIKKIFASVWRQGLGVLFGYGVTQLSLIMLVSGVGAGASASVLLAVRYLNFTNIVAQVPFYVKIPAMSQLRSNLNNVAADSIAKERMTHSLLLFICGAVVTFIVLPSYLDFVNSSVGFVGLDVWTLLCIGAIFERIGAMQLMVMATHNVIYAHVAALVFAIPFLATLALTFSLIGADSYVVSFVIGNICYAYYSFRQLSSFVPLRNDFIWKAVKYPICLIFILGITSWGITSFG